MSKRVLITGAASGIGQAAADALRRRGCTVVGLDLKASEDVIACDVRDDESVTTAVAQAIERLGGLDVLINSAGIGDPQSAARPPGEDALRVLDVNLLGTWRVTAAAIEALRESRGRVINIASGLAHLTVPFATAYTISKRGVVAYSDSLRLEMHGEVYVTTVYPGYIRTPIHDASSEKGIALEGMVPAEPLASATAALVKAALADAPPRDLATSRQGTFGYAIFRHMPRRVLDRLTHSRIRQFARRGHFDKAEMAADLRNRFSTGR